MVSVFFIVELRQTVSINTATLTLDLWPMPISFLNFKSKKLNGYLDLESLCHLLFKKE